MSLAVVRHERATTKEVLTLGDCSELARELARRIARLHRAPELVVAVAEGGLFVGRVVADELRLPMVSVRVRRGGSVVKRRLAALPIVGWLARVAARWRPLQSALKLPLHAIDWIARGASMADWMARDQSLDGRRVVLVDDAQRTGATLEQARRLVTEHGGVVVATAVLTWAQHGNAAAAPDAFIGRRLQHYPWSAGSPHADELVRWLAQRGLP